MSSLKFNVYNLLWSSFSSTGNSTVLRILVQPSFLKSKHFKCSIKTTGSSSKVTCCQAATSWFVLLHVTPSNWSRPTKISRASRTEDAFYKRLFLYFVDNRKDNKQLITSITSLRVKNGSMLSEEWSPSRWTLKRSFPPKMSLIGERPKSVVRVIVLLLRVPLIT